MTLKRNWRRAVGTAFRLLGKGTAAALDGNVNRRLRPILSHVGGGTLLGFSALADEPDVGPFLREWLAAGKPLALPAWLGGNDLSLRRVGDLDRDLAPGRAGILEPRGGLPPVPPEDVSVALVPGRAFSERLQRLGRGAGCYDRTLGGSPAARIGVAYDFQVFPELPCGALDVGMDAIVTPGRVIAAPGVDILSEAVVPFADRRVR